MFEIFASVKQEDGELGMSYSDFLRAMSPYNYTEIFEGTDDYVKEHTPKILKKVDVNSDGTISFTEFFFFLVLLQVSPVKIKRQFKKHEGGKMTKEETSIALKELRKGTQAGKRQQEKVALDARQIKCSDDDFMATNKAIVNLLFEGKTHVTFKDFMDLQVQFKEDLWHYEFHHF